MNYEPPERVNYAEKRKFERAYFSPDDAVTGVIIIPDLAPPPLSGNIADLSVGGVYFILKKSSHVQLAIGSTLTFKEIKANMLNCLELNIEMQLRRIHNYEFVDHVGLGCEFTYINEKAAETIKRLVEWGLKANDFRS
jgi:c-di-GMP-binding flagellar brake protein YcgR